MKYLLVMSLLFIGIACSKRLTVEDIINDAEKVCKEVTPKAEQALCIIGYTLKVCELHKEIPECIDQK